ncbi:MAG: glycogen synthase GlgA [Deltaproteobacteria bacterium]|nr:glycogen synthase GlgA [Deltaproteobacteria bacterium]
MSLPRIALIASEIEPFAKTGGLADMVGSFSHALVKLGRSPTLFLPKYASIPARYLGEVREEICVSAGDRSFAVKIVSGKIPTGAELYFFEIPRLFDRPGLYGESSGDFPDNCLRFTVFCRAVLEWIRGQGNPYEILHCHDWQTALIPITLKTRLAQDPAFAKSRCLLTLHNMAYQGNFPREEFPTLGLEERYFHADWLEFYQKFSLLKGGIVSADALTTVSPTYAREILESELGFGMQGVLERRRDRLMGILNGIDEEEWDPKRSPDLPFHYSAEDLRGKAACKAALQRELGLPERPETPLFGTISRLVDQKGIDLLLEAFGNAAELDFQWALLGQGEARFETGLRRLAEKMPERVALRLSYDVGLSQRLTAGADFLAMPSRFEPCGYNQLYALRYGTLPIVHGIGGLKDSVRDLSQDPEDGTGFVLENLGGDALREGLHKAAELFRRKDALEAARRRAMAADFTWKYSARQYLDLYDRMLREPSWRPIPPGLQPSS